VEGQPIAQDLASRVAEPLSLVDVAGPDAREILARLSRMSSEIGALQMRLLTNDFGPAIPSHQGTMRQDGVDQDHGGCEPSPRNLPWSEVDSLRAALEAERTIRHAAEERASRAEARLARFSQLAGGLRELRSELNAV